MSVLDDLISGIDTKHMARYIDDRIADYLNDWIFENQKAYDSLTEAEQSELCQMWRDDLIGQL